MEAMRVAEVGDLLFEQVGNIRYVGIVYKITADRYHHKTAYIKWIKSPNCYSEASGYGVSNIHNQRQRFELVKARKGSD